MSNLLPNLQQECGADASPTVVEQSTQPPRTIFGLGPLPVPSAEVASRRHGPRNLEGTELLARYEVEGVIGQGGMATVYRGRHKAIQKAVAIKVLDDGLEWRLDAAERFLQEAQVTSRVVHENVVEVTDFGTTAERVVFCVMELLQGESLAELIASSGPLPVPRAANIMRQICSALEAAHRHGIIHRDLKPANCVRSPRTSNPDFVKLLDFGIACVAHDEDAVRDHEVARPMPTQCGFIIGTPDYMAPEQAREQPFDHRVDVYAAGGLFFELLTGRKPYIGKSVADLLAAHLHFPVPDPGHLDRSLSPAVREIVTTAMAKDANDRFPSMGAMSAAIVDAVAQQERDEIRLATRPRRRTAAVVLAIGVLALGGWLVSEPPVEPRATPSKVSADGMSADESPPAAVEPAAQRRGGMPSPLAPPSSVAPVMFANVEPTTEPSTAAAPQPSVPRPSASKQSRKDRGALELPSAAPRDAAPAADATPDAEPMRARISEVKDPFATEVGPVSALSVSLDERSQMSPNVPDVAADE